LVDIIPFFSWEERKLLKKEYRIQEIGEKTLEGSPCLPVLTGRSEAI
jgi:hypothetical protein